MKTIDKHTLFLSQIKKIQKINDWEKSKIDKEEVEGHYKTETIFIIKRYNDDCTVQITRRGGALSQDSDYSFPSKEAAILDTKYKNILESLVVKDMIKEYQSDR